MTAFELITLIGEFVSTEIEEIGKLEYIKENGELTAFSIITNIGKKFIVRVKETN